MGLSKFCLGAAQLGMDYGINNYTGKPSFEESLAIVRFALENGITTFDTAPGYGDSEKILGQCLQEIGGRADLISKLPSLDWKLGPEEIVSLVRKTLEATLENLQVVRLPIYLFHRYEDMYHRERLALKELLALKSSGLVERIGASVYTAGEAEACLRNPACEVIQVPFNLADKRLLEIDFFRGAKERAKTVLVRSVFLQGLFFKRDLPGELQDFEPFRQQARTLAENEGLELAEMAFRYALSFDDIDSVIIGVETIRQLRRNLDIFRKGALPTSVLDKINGLGTAPEYIVDPRQWPKSS